MATPHLVLAGSAFALGGYLEERVGREADVVILPTAAAFTGLAESALAIVEVLGSQRPEALLIGDRDGAQTEHFAQRIREAAAVVITDGSPLHFRTTVRDSIVHEALANARLILTVGSIGTVLGATMIDPRGGAPTTGLGLFDDCVTAVSSPTLSRSRELLGTSEILREITPTSAWIRHEDGWSEL